MYPGRHLLHKCEFVQEAHLLLLHPLQFELLSTNLPEPQFLGHFPPTNVIPALQTEQVVWLVQD